MNKIKVMLVFGTRPEAVKMCPLIKKMEKDNRIEPIVCVTSQHKEMLSSVLEMFNVIPDYDLEIMKHEQTLIDVANRVQEGVSCVIEKVSPDIVLVHGDTTTTLYSALASSYNKVPVGHVEAGLRSFDMYSPFPEEINRVLTGRLSSYHFAPTERNKENLKKEGIEKNVWVTGNTVIDALLSVINKEYEFKNELLNSIDFVNKKIILLTAHRRENWGKSMENIFESVVKLADENEDVEFIFPVHKNPRIREVAHKYFDGREDKIHIVEPLEYIEFANLMSKVYLIMTDSGGIQEEAPALGKPVVVLRTETERPEAIESGTVKLSGVDSKNIFNIVDNLVKNKEEYNGMALAKNPYGDGTACDQIIELIVENVKNDKGGIR